MLPAWAALAVTALTKQTVLPAVLLLALLYTWKRPLSLTLEGLGIAAAVVLLLALPFTLDGYSPPIAIEPLWSTVALHIGHGIERAFQMVSLDLPNLWALVVRMVARVQGSQRLAYLDFVPLRGPLSAHQIAIALALLLSRLVTLMTLRHTGGAPHSWLVAAATLLAGGFS
jgi:hypothetical protein